MTYLAANLRPSPDPMDSLDLPLEPNAGGLPAAGGIPRNGIAQPGIRTDLRDIAASANPMLKVGHGSQAKKVAGAICNVVRESRGNNPPSLMATGPDAINQAMKAVAIARKYLLEEAEPIDLLVRPRFEQDLRAGSNVVFELYRSPKIFRNPSEDDLSAKPKTDVYKLAGAIAGRVREAQTVAITTKGAVPVLTAVKAIALAEQYLEESSTKLQFAVSLVDLENPQISNATSTYLHFALFLQNPR